MRTRSQMLPPDVQRAPVRARTSRRRGARKSVWWQDTPRSVRRKRPAHCTTRLAHIPSAFHNDLQMSPITSVRVRRGECPLEDGRLAFSRGWAEARAPRAQRCADRDDVDGLCALDVCGPKKRRRTGQRARSVVRRGRRRRAAGPATVPALPVPSTGRIVLRGRELRRGPYDSVPAAVGPPSR